MNILTDRAPGFARERWGFEGWQLHDAALWEQLLAEARERETAARERQARIVAVDINPAARKTAERMVKCAGYKRFVDFCAAKSATVLDHAGAVAGAAVVADTTETPLSLMHDAMTLIGELRRAPELTAAPVAALTRDGLKMCIRDRGSAATRKSRAVAAPRSARFPREQLSVQVDGLRIFGKPGDGRPIRVKRSR